MPRALRNIIAGVLFVAVTLIVLSRPGVQTWLVARWVSDWSPGTLQVREVDTDGKHFVLRGVVWKNAHLTVTFPTIEGVLRWQDALRGKLDVVQARARGWYLTFDDEIPSERDIQPGGKIDWSEKLQELRSSLRQRIPVEIEALELEGAVRLPKRGAKEAPTAVLRIKGSNLGPGKDARFEIRSVAKNPDVDDQIVDLDATTEVAIHMSAANVMERMVTETRAAATGQRFPNGTSLNVRTTLDMTGDDLAFGISASGSGNNDLRELLIIDARTEPGTRTVAGSWRIDVNQEDLRPYSLGFQVPEFSAKGFGLLANTGGIRVAGELEASVKDLGQVDARLRGVGAMQFRAVFDVIRHKRGYGVHRLSAKAFNDRPVAAFQVLQPVELDEALAMLSLANPEGDLFHLEVENVVSEWIHPFLPALDFKARELRGSFMANLEGEAVQVRTLRPITAHGLTLDWKGKQWFSDIDLLSDLQLIFSKKGWAVDVSRIEGLDQGNRLFLGQGMIGRVPGLDHNLKLTGTLDVDLPASRRQPFARRAALIEGHGQVKLNLAVKESAWQALAEASLEGARDVAGHALPKISTSMRVDRAVNGSLDLEMPLSIEAQGRESNVTILGSLQRGKEKRKGDVIVRSQDAHLVDVQALVAALAKYDLMPQNRTDDFPRSSQPAWGVVDSTIRVALAGLVLPGQSERGSIDMLIHGNAEQLVIENMAISLGGKGTALGKGEINYSARASLPYHFAALFQAKDFDPAPFLAALDPGRPPLVEGQFDLDASCKGSTSDFSDLAEITTATVSLTGRGGRFHAFDAAASLTDFPRMEVPPSKFAAWVALASGAAKNDRRFAAGTNIIKRLADLNYDQATFELVHRPGQDTVVREFSLIAPEVRLLGEGHISHQVGDDWKEGRVKLTLELAARGEYADDIRLLGLAGEKPDSLGYLPLARTLQVEGTLRDFGTESLVDLVSTSMPKQP